MVFYSSFYESFKCLTDEECCKCMKMVFDYGLYGIEPKEKLGIVRSMFIMVKRQIDTNNQRYLNSLKSKKRGGEADEDVFEQDESCLQEDNGKKKKNTSSCASKRTKGKATNKSAGKSNSKANNKSAGKSNSKSDSKSAGKSNSKSNSETTAIDIKSVTAADEEILSEIKTIDCQAESVVKARENQNENRTKASENQTDTKVQANVYVYENVNDNEDDNENENENENVNDNVSVNRYTYSAQPSEKSSPLNSAEAVCMYGEYRNIKMTQKEYDALRTELGHTRLNRCLEFFSRYLIRKPYHKSAKHYEDLRGWVLEAVAKEDNGKKGARHEVYDPSFDIDLEDIFERPSFAVRNT